MPMIGDRPEASIDTVIYGTDFSSSAENAGSYARILASGFSASLIVSHAFLLDRPAQEAEMGKGVVSRQREHLHHLLEQRAHALSSPELQAHATLLDGNPEDALPAFAEKHGSCVLVLGTHGAGRIAHALVGSVAERVLRATRWPCLTVGPRTAPPKDPKAPFQTILFATDLGPSAINAALFAVAFAQRFEGELHVLNVLPAGAARNSEQWAETQKHYRHRLEQLIPEHAREFCNPRTYVENGSAHDRIFEHIRERGVDLLVLGIRKSTHTDIEMRTSGAFRLIAESPCPVLTITS